MVAPPTVKTYAEGEKYIKQAIKDGIITKQDQEYIRRYTNREEHGDLNYRMRNGLKLTKAQIELRDGLSRALTKLPIYDGDLYRGIGFDTLDELNNAMNKFIKLPADQAFMSTSISEAKAIEYMNDKPFTSFFYVSGLKGRLVNGLSAKVEDVEILFDWGTRLEILELDKFDLAHIIFNVREI